MTDSKEEVNKAIEEKNEKGSNKSFWEKIPPIFLIGGAVLIFLAFKGLTLEGGSSQIWLIVVVIVVIYLLSKSNKEELPPVDPKRAEILAERECERKLRWGQWPLGTEYTIGPHIELFHKDGRGVYYNIRVEVRKPLEGIEYYTAKVVAEGKEREFTTLIQTNLPFTGRELRHERDITKVPEFIQRSNRYGILESIWGLKK